MDTGTFLVTAQVAEDLVASEAVADRWEEPSALSGYTVGGLAAHLARAVLTVSRYLDRPAAPGEPVDAAGYFLHALGTHDPHASAFHEQVRARAVAEAAEGPAALVARLRDARHRVADRLATIEPEFRIAALDEVVLTVEDYLDTRLVELVVHLDDLAVSVDREVPDGVPREAYTTVAAILARIAVERAGPVATIRSLARRERHPDAVRAF